MQIVATFDNYEEMVAFARKILTEEHGTGGMPDPRPAPQTTSVPIVPVQQPAPVMTAPVQQPAAVTPVPVQQSGQVPAAMPVNQAPAVPTTASTYTLDELARAAMTLMDAGRQLDLQGLLRSFGVEALPALPQEQYGAFATALRGMGAQI